MAIPPNVNNPSGFTPIKHGSGGTPNRTNTGADYSIAGGLASNIYRGSLVKPTGAGNNIDVVSAGANPSIGAFKGVNYVDAGGSVQFRPFWGSGQTVVAGGVAEALVFDDPELLFDAQVSGTAGLASTNIGNTANVLIGTGSVLTGQAGDMVDQSTLSNSSSTQQLQVTSLRGLTNNNYGQFARAVVAIFLHYKQAAAGAGTPY
jgi:hypothetical protein